MGYSITKQVYTSYLFLKLRIIIYFVEVKEKSSHYGLDMLGYTCATRAKTVRCDNES